MKKISYFKGKLLGIGCEKVKCIWWMNIGAERIWEKSSKGIVPRVELNGTSGIIGGIEQLCFLFADSNDTVIMRNNSSSIVEACMDALGLEKPEILLLAPSIIDINRSVSELICERNQLISLIQEYKKEFDEVLLVPYAVTQTEEMISQITGCKLIGPPKEISQWINSKVNTRKLAQQAGLPIPEGLVCRDVESIVFSLHELKKKYGTSVVVKDAYGASGKGLYIIDNQKSFDFFLEFLDRKKMHLKSSELEVIVERWYKNSININYQIFVRDDGHIIYIPPKIQIMNQGVYIGSEYPARHYLNIRQMELLEDAAAVTGKKLWKEGYRGIAGIDAIISGSGDIYPLIEINGRFTLSTYISFIPDQLGCDKYYRSEYFNISDIEKFDAFLSEFERNRYSTEIREGIIIYSLTEPQNGNAGRVFVLFIYNNPERLHGVRKKIADVINPSLVRYETNNS